jgi:hypothetical protein
VLNLFNEQTHLVDCMDTVEPCDCQQQDHCDIRQPMEALNAMITEQLRNFTLDSFFRADVSGARPRYLSILPPAGRRRDAERRARGALIPRALLARGPRRAFGTRALRTEPRNGGSTRRKRLHIRRSQPEVVRSAG